MMRRKVVGMRTMEAQIQVVISKKLNQSTKRSGQADVCATATTSGCFLFLGWMMNVISSIFKRGAC